MTVLDSEPCALAPEYPHPATFPIGCHRKGQAFGWVGWFRASWLMALAWIGTVGVLAATPSDRHWAFQPVQDPPLPEVRSTAWCRTTVDRFVLSELESKGLAPPPPAERRVLARRLSYDLTGLPPDADALDRLARDPSTEAIDSWIEALLASPAYGEHWGRQWLDVVRYADTAGETADYPVPEAWRYRNYVIEAFNENIPFDQFIREQVAGDLLAKSSPGPRYSQQVVATGYLAISRRFGFDSENYHHLTIQDSIDNIGQSFLGLTLGCARCHNHKYDPVSLADYYALYGIFESTRYPFPGSEQKQRTRALAPLVPPVDSRSRMREFEHTVASLANRIEKAGLGVPSAILRSVDDIDGDFELQAPAAGGSKGVLVPPWVYEGAIAVSTDSQSPFRNLHPSGRIGATLPDGTNRFEVWQLLPRSGYTGGDSQHFNLDFRVQSNSPDANGCHWLLLHPSDGAPIRIAIGRNELSWQPAGHAALSCLAPLQPGAWCSLQLEIDNRRHTLSGSLATETNWGSFGPLPLSSDWIGPISGVRFRSEAQGHLPRPSLSIDNIAIQESPFTRASLVPPGMAASRSEPGLRNIDAQLASLIGIDGDFELQTEGSAPQAPWHPGPDSVVRIRASAQSAIAGGQSGHSLGISLPNDGAYNGFGQTLPRVWQAKDTGRLRVGFDFRCPDAARGGDGSWRFYVGHGPGNSAAFELGINASHLFIRSGNSRTQTAPLATNTWYRVRAELDLASRTFTGSVESTSPASSHPFNGELASGWDGLIDYLFIDSYGHLPGIKPALDADNFVLRPSEADASPSADSVNIDVIARTKQTIAGIRAQRARMLAEAESAKAELTQLLAAGPVAMAYAVSDATPQDSRIHLRGEPDRPGDVAPRGLLPVLGGKPLGTGHPESGRRELAQWIASSSNPLTARVFVNRVWQAYFGEGLVGTPNDFGLRGQPPSHPALLDHLATRFVQSGWSVKDLHRLILRSAAYQATSHHTDRSSQASSHDGVEPCPVETSVSPLGVPITQPALPAQHARRRLRAEEIRDSILQVSGEMDRTPGREHPFPLSTTWGYTQHGPFSAVYDHTRRSVYLMSQRIRRHPYLALFDGADPNTSTAGRRTTTVPTQALYFLNDPFIHRLSLRFAARILSAAPSRAGRIEFAYRTALGRNPTSEELATATQFLEAAAEELTSSGGHGTEAGAMAALARVLFASNEFLTVD